jgi:hypothetical protein
MEDVEDESQEAASEGSAEDDLLDGLSKWSANRSKRNMQSLKFLSFKAIAANAKRNPYSNPNASPLPLHILCMKCHIFWVPFRNLISIFCSCTFEE